MKQELKEKINQLTRGRIYVDEFMDSQYLGILIDQLDPSLGIVNKKTGKTEEYYLTMRCIDEGWTVCYSNGKRDDDDLKITRDELIEAVVDMILEIKDMFD